MSSLTRRVTKLEAAATLFALMIDEELRAYILAELGKLPPAEADKILADYNSTGEPPC